MYDSFMAKMPSTSELDKPNTSRHGSLTEMFESVTPYKRNSKRHGEITRPITEFIAKDMMPLSTVTKLGFMALINSTVYPPVHTSVWLPYCTKSAKRKSLQSLKQWSFLLPLLICGQAAQLSLTRVLQSILLMKISTSVLVAYKLPTSQMTTQENIAAGLREGLASWDLHEEKHVCITTDNTSNMVLAAQLNEWTRLQCYL